MKKFKYRAESYLNYVLFLRDQKLKELKEIEERKIQKIILFNKAEDKLKESYNLNSTMGKEQKDIRIIQNNNLFITKLKEDIQHISLAIAEVEEEYNHKNYELLEIQKKLKKIEKHKEIELDRYKEEYKKTTQKITDDINTIRRGRKNAKSL